MSTNYITIYSLDFSKCFVIYYEGYFYYANVTRICGLSNYILVSSSGVDIVHDNSAFLLWNKYADVYYSFNKYPQECSEEEFWEAWKPLEYKANFERLING